LKPDCWVGISVERCYFISYTITELQCKTKQLRGLTTALNCSPGDAEVFSELPNPEERLLPEPNVFDEVLSPVDEENSPPVADEPKVLDEAV
jgi:hypothetical protein